jgi:hypothetical protein
MEQIAENKWKIESLRLTNFLKSDFNGINLEHWLAEISGNKPLSINKNVNFFQGLAQVDSAMVNLQWNFDRLDLILNSNAPTIESNIGDYTDLNNLMQNIIFKMFDLKEFPTSRRLAIGVILNAQIKTMEEGTDFLQSKLKSVSNIKGTTDFLFRINKPVKSEVLSGLNLNRLMTWSIGQLQLINIPLNVLQPNIAQPNTIQPLKSELICRLEMDFNSEEKIGTEIPVDVQKEIARELLNEVINVADKGEFGVK